MISHTARDCTKIAVCHPRLGRGGSEARALWALQSLKDGYDVTLITGGPVDLDGLNAFYGTSLSPRDFAIRQAPVPMWLNLLRKVGVCDALDGTPYVRLCRKIASEFDVLISTYNLCDFGISAIHFIADFSWDDSVRRALHPARPGLARFIYEDNALRRAYLSFARFLGRSGGHNVLGGQDLIYANSQWTAGVMRDKYNVNVDILYPPVPGEFPSIPWAQKENGFVCLGRIDSAKRIETMIDILSRVRKAGHDVHLHIIGRIGDDVYGRQIAQLAHANDQWVIADGPKHGDAKRNLLAAHRFGIHGCHEAFGIAVAEMVKAGCIAFVPNEGGQAEIVNHPLLTYTNVDDAVGKIVRVLEASRLQAELCGHLASQAERFSAEAFMTGLRAVVQKFLACKS